MFFFSTDYSSHAIQLQEGRWHVFCQAFLKQNKIKQILMYKIILKLFEVSKNENIRKKNVWLCNVDILKAKNSVKICFWFKRKDIYL